MEELLIEMKKELISEINSSKTEMMKKLTELETSMNFYNAEYEEHKYKVKELERESAEVKSEMQKLNVENCKLKMTVKKTCGRRWRTTAEDPGPEHRNSGLP